MPERLQKFPDFAGQAKTFEVFPPADAHESKDLQKLKDKNEKEAKR